MHFLIVKFGALGDVVRTSYFAHALKQTYGEALRLSWLTSSASLPLLRFNIWIDDLWTAFSEAKNFKFSKIFSLDDEQSIAEGVMFLSADQIIGTLLDEKGNLTYSKDSAPWFDMGLNSKFGKKRADELKKLNSCGHAEIFSKILNVKTPKPEFYGNPVMDAWAKAYLKKDVLNIGINPFAGGRWPSKELPENEFVPLIQGLQELFSRNQHAVDITLLGAGKDFLRNQEIAQSLKDPSVKAIKTDDSILRLAAVIKNLNYLFTSDSLAMHLAIAQRIPFLAFFAPTSSSEIDDFGVGRKVRSLANDYCSYRKNVDNSSITAERLIKESINHMTHIPQFSKLFQGNLSP